MADGPPAGVGHADPIPSSLGAAILAGMASGFTSPAMIGRADELSRLEAVLAQAEQGRPQVVLVAGDAGVGKTRLRAQLAAAAGQALMVAGRYDEARRWGNEALSIAHAAGSADIEADALITLGLMEMPGDPGKAHSLMSPALGMRANSWSRPFPSR
jgi:hypothetical protein